MADLHRLAAAVMRLLPPEAAHRAAVAALARGVVPGVAPVADSALKIRLWGREFPNPVGLAAGFDKDGEAFDACLRLGFGFVEIGSVTPRPQPGNPRPRLFRLTADQAIINRMGFNSRGLDFVAARLASRRAGPGTARMGTAGPGIVGANLGKNKDSPDAAADYAQGAARLAPLADYLVINVSSPNTPGLRALQGRDRLSGLIAAVAAARDAAMGRRAGDGAPPLLLKIAPDLTAEDRRDIAEVALASADAGGIDGLIVSNTTVARPAGLRSRHSSETGGLSGRPLLRPSTALLAEMYRLTAGRLPLIGVGGIAGGADAYAKIRAGASLVQLYSALVYQGPGLVRRIQAELAARLREDGFATLAEAVGADHRPGTRRA